MLLFSQSCSKYIETLWPTVKWYNLYSFAIKALFSKKERKYLFPATNMAIFFFFFKDLFIWMSQLQRQSKRARSPICQFTSQKASTTRAGPDWNQEPGATWIPCWYRSLCSRAIFCCFARRINRELDGKWNSHWDTECLHHRQQLHPLCHNKTPQSILFNRRAYNCQTGRREKVKCTDMAHCLVHF